MTIALRNIAEYTASRNPRLRLTRASFMALAVVADVFSIVGIAVCAGLIYHGLSYGHLGAIMDYAPIGAIIALSYTATFINRGAYAIERYVIGPRGFSAVITAWNIAFVLLALLVFLSKTGDMVSRGWIILFYAVGLTTALMSDRVIANVLQRAISANRVRRRRIMLVGDMSGIASFQQSVQAPLNGVDVVDIIELPNIDDPADTDHAEAIEKAVNAARIAKIEDIVIVSDLTLPKGIERIVDAFMDVPVRIHIATSPKLQKGQQLTISQVGDATTLALTDPRTGFFSRAPKRIFDVTAASLGLLLLSPLFAIVAVMIKLESAGPVFFRQRRRGFNHEEFRIWKFRTMTSMDDGDQVRQAEKFDPRVTRVGRLLRRTNIDELPQLINVIFGDMSLVGPRPHAVAHDRDYERRIERYARRLNVRPGITGWAQVNGCRGRTETDNAMKDRVKYDLYYIDNWSLAFDLYIILLTIVSPKAFRNAY